MSKKNFFIGHQHSVSALCLVLVLSMFGFTSCVDEDQQIGVNLVQSNGGMNVLTSTDHNTTLAGKCYSTTDSLITSSYDEFCLGSYKDDNFGKVSASIYTKLSLSQSQVNFASIGNVDSIVYCFAYSGAFRHDTSISNMNMTVNIYELTELIGDDTLRAKDNIAFNHSPIYSKNVVINPSQGVTIGSQILNPHLRLCDSTSSFFNRIKTASYQSNSEFQDAFKGIKVEALSTDVHGMMVYINMKSSLSGIKVYYTLNNGSSNYYSINFPASGGKFMHIDYDNSGSVYASQISGDSADASNYMFIGALGQSEVKLDINGILNWYNQDSIKGCALNRAELILPVDVDKSGNKSLYPSSLNTYRREGGRYYLLVDEGVSYNWLGNKYDDNIKAYRIDITSFLQNYLLGKYDNSSIYLVPNERISSAKRVVLKGINSDNPPKLNIIYSHPAND